jgi:hypothetical protein
LRSFNACAAETVGRRSVCVRMDANGSGKREIYIYIRTR